MSTVGYRATVGQAITDRGRRAPRGAKLATNLRLRGEVQARLKRNDSPVQIAGRLKIDFPDDPEMRVCAETIYQSLYVQARGGLKRDSPCTCAAAGQYESPAGAGLNVAAAFQAW